MSKDGAITTQLDGPMVDKNIREIKISPDGSRVVYLADEDTEGVNEIYSVPIGGGAATRLNGPLVAGGRVSSFVISPDSNTVVYSAEDVGGSNA